MNNPCFRLKEEIITKEITLKNAGLILNVIFKHHQMGLSVNNMIKIAIDNTKINCIHIRDGNPKSAIRQFLDQVSESAILIADSDY